MTPTLSGRWQTRLALYLFVGLPVSALFAIWAGDGSLTGTTLPYRVLTALLILGLVLDPVYIWIQTFRWDQDWPFVFQLLFTVLEFLAVIFAASQDWLGFITPAEIDANAWLLAWHFATVLALSFVALLGLFQVFNLRWRFNGGRFTRF